MLTPVMGGDIFLLEWERGDAMTRRYPGIFLGILLSFCLSVSGLAAKGKSMLEIPEGCVGIFTYGSLISLASMEEALGHKYNGPVHEVHLEGYERSWTCVRPFNDPQAIAAGARKIDAYFRRGTERVPISGAAELNVQPRKKGRLNGILYLISNEELLGLDKREHGYRRADVSEKIEEFRFRGGRVYVYEGVPGSPPVSAADKGTIILIKEFLDMVTGACDSRGKDFRTEFDKSTRPPAFPVLSYKDIVWEKAE
jgi:hypothetical protein